jgi:hypothetical protein
MLGFQLVLAVGFGFVGYREAAKFEREHGRGPFGVPALGWGFITGASLIVGAVLLAVARRRAQKAPVLAPVSAPVAVAPPAVFGSSMDWSAGPAAPPREDLWAAPAPIAPSAAARDILPGR